MRYGEGETFAVRPAADGRSFRPGEQAINLTPESPVENQVDFTDTSAFTVAGTITLGSGSRSLRRRLGQPVRRRRLRHDHQSRRQLRAFGPADGRDDSDNRLRRITAQRTQGEGDVNLFAFDPALREFAAQSDRTGIDFVVTTERTLTGFVGGGCNRSLGTVTLRVYTEDGCFDRTIQVQNTIGEQLPPQRTSST